MSITIAKVRTSLMRLCAALMARRPSASHSRRTASLAGFFTFIKDPAETSFQAIKEPEFR
jgi:hypothetical protein